MFGNPETTTGGRALKFLSSVRIDVRRIDSIKRDGEIVGNRVRAKVAGGQGCAAVSSSGVRILCTVRAFHEGCIVDMAVEAGVAINPALGYTIRRRAL